MVMMLILKFGALVGWFFHIGPDSNSQAPQLLKWHCRCQTGNLMKSWLKSVTGMVQIGCAVPSVPLLSDINFVLQLWKFEGMRNGQGKREGTRYLDTTQITQNPVLDKALALERAEMHRFGTRLIIMIIITINDHISMTSSPPSSSSSPPSSSWSWWWWSSSSPYSLSSS